MLNQILENADNSAPYLLSEVKEKKLMEWELSDSSNLADVLRKVGAPALFVPKEYGGNGLGPRDAINIQMALASYSPSLSVMMMMHNFTIVSLAGMTEVLPGAKDLLHSVASDNLLVASGFAEGRSGAHILDSNMLVEACESGYTISGRKKPCTMSHVMDILTAGVAVHDAAGNKLSGIAIVPGNAEGMTRKQFWTGNVLRGADSHEIILESVFVKKDDLLIPEQQSDESKLAVAYAELCGLCWFQLFTTASYLGMAATLIERGIALQKFDDVTLQQLSSSLELSIHALFGLANRMENENFSEALFCQILLVRYGIQDQITAISAKAIERLGGLEYITNPEINYLFSACQCLSFHPLSQGASREMLAQFSKSVRAEI